MYHRLRTIDFRNRDKINASQAVYNKRNCDSIAKKQKERRLAQMIIDPEKRILKFKKDIKDGANYICKSCKRCLFKRSVKFLNEKDGETLQKNKIPWRFLMKTIKTTLTGAILLIKNKRLVLCHTCWKYIQKGEMAPMSEANGLQLDPILKINDLRITDLERQTIARSLLYLTIKEMPKRKCNKMEGRVIHVPLDNAGKP